MTNLNPNFNIRERPVWSAHALPAEPTEFILGMLDRAKPFLAEDFKGVTTDGNLIPGLFALGKAGSPTDVIKSAADAFIASLSPEKRNATMFPIDSKEWHSWSNIHPFLMRHGAFLNELETAQRDLALGVLKESMSPTGFDTLRSSMKLNDSTGELLGSNEEYGEWLYWLSIMGTPSLDTPWGWQFDGHHLIINCFVLGNQVVMTPMFMGSEPIASLTGKHAGTRAFDAEVQGGLKLAQSLSKEQRSKAILGQDVIKSSPYSSYKFTGGVIPSSSYSRTLSTGGVIFSSSDGSTCSRTGGVS